MNDNIEWLRDKKILHFAQEKSLKIWLDRHNIKYLTADFYNQADLKIDIESTGLEESSYDMIVCNHVLEHVSDYTKALKELYRNLRPNGKLIVSFPVDLSLETVYEDKNISTKEGRIEYFGQHDHQRVFGKDSPTLLEHIGFKVTEINGNSYNNKIKPVIGPANYDYNVLWCLIK